MVKRDTKLLIADAFVKMVKNSSLSQARIADLIGDLGINRNTFYYHFNSKYDIALWILRVHLAQELRRSLPEKHLVCNPTQDELRESLPYYVHIEVGARTLDGAPFFKALALCVLSDSDFYRKLFAPQEIDFRQQVVRLWRPAFYNDIEFILDKRYMPETTKRLLADTCANTMVAAVGYLLANVQDAESLLDETMNPFWNLLHESLHNAIQVHPINRKNPPSDIGA